jgi:hypothetical protein
VSIVSGFLNASTSTNANLAARPYLTTEERTKWSSQGQTTILTSLDIEASRMSADGDRATVTVTGDLAGTVSASGAFTPTLQGGPSPQSQTVTLSKVAGQWRISGLTYTGLLISETQFEHDYDRQIVYFFDQEGTRLVPYLRYRPATSTQLLATWLMSQLVNSPSATTVTTDLPSVPDAGQVTVTMHHATITVELPGSNQLDAATKYQMAAQVAYTLDGVAPGMTMRITDGGALVEIPELASTRFSVRDFARYEAPTVRDPQLYFIDNGSVHDANGAEVPGLAGNGPPHLTSVALAQVAPSSSLLRVAATSGPPSQSQLFIGLTGAALHETALRGRLSRPAWAPGLDEAWIADGGTLYRVDGSRAEVRTVPITLASGTAPGVIKAVRLSPDGSRIALVIAVGGGTAQIWIGVVARTQTAVQVSGLTPISPADKVVSDVAWGGPCTLDAIGHDLRPVYKPSVFTVLCDGSGWTQPSDEGIGNLPQGGASSITALPDAPVSVAAGGAVWVSAGSTLTGYDAYWTGPNGRYTDGTNPIYAQ